MNSDEYYLGENERAYVSPTISRDEQLGFIDNLRNMIGRENQRIATQTQNLGTNVPSSLGGLTGSGSYFQQRYQTMPVENAVNQLKATAQAKALNDIMTNYEAQAKNRYTQAYRAAAARKKARENATTTTGGENPLQISSTPSDTDDETFNVSTTDWSGSLGKINSTAEGKLYYLDSSPTASKSPIYIQNLTSADDLNSTVARLGSGYNGQRKFLNGVQYIYLDTGQFAPSWYRVGGGAGVSGGW